MKRRSTWVGLLAIAGVSVLPSAALAQDADVEVAVQAPTPAPTASTLDDLKQEIERLRARVDELETKAKAPAPAPGVVAPPPAGRPGFLQSILGVTAIDLTAYAQAQFEWHEDSEDQLAQGGQPLNQDRFLVRRGRVRLDAAWTWSALSIEVDGNTTRGPAFGLRRAEASVLWRGPWGPASNDLAALRGNGPAPLMMLTVGLTDIPFGYELNHSARERVFMERSTGSLALFPGEPDVGARLSGGVSFFRYSLAVENGEPVDERSATPARERNEAKDFIGRLGVDARPVPSLRVLGGVSALRGEGFHAGTDGTKDEVQWKDLNENAAIDPGELVAAPGAAPTPSSNFSRWAFGLDLRFEVQTPIGQTSIYGEAALAQNLDRGLFIADPVLTGIDVRELAAYGAVVQELSRYAFVGLRVDYYDPNGDFFDTRAGKLLPASQAVRTISPVVGAGMPDVFRVVLQYDNVHDALTRDERGVPADLPNDRFTARLQVSL